MKRFFAFTVVLCAFFSSPSKALELCEYVLYTPEAFHSFLERELPAGGIVPFRDPVKVPGVQQETRLPLIREGSSIVGYMDYKENLLTSEFTLVITDADGGPLLEIQETSGVNNEITWTRTNDAFPRFRIMDTGHGIFHYHRDQPINISIWKSKFENEVVWLLRYLQGTEKVKTLQYPYLPENHFHYSLLTDPGLAPYVSELSIGFRNGVLTLAGRVNYSTYQRLISKAHSLGYFNVNVHHLILDSAAVAPFFHYSPRVAHCY